ncbi:acyl-CoA dehydrogenase [Actinomadura sp. LD22]|uniref:Acyl-CoA dehydrogenase n=1 Tax=Actinomadura physcomitrii TaxID=2650748 RepID=A0A6I4MLL2_9ACTN|nr:acyl-CoA dehydrogenase family protein [Actinomadura physcomitrii]MWA03609.1 acyl-CoA dehydrogenase [Actinomadura physcomitrii]
MDFELGERADDVRSQLREMLRAGVPDDFLGAFTDDPADLELTMRFCAELAEAGLLCIGWPAEYGGGDGTVWDQTVVREEMWAWHEPRGPQYMGVNWVGPAIMRHGTPEQKARHLPPIAAGSVIWCQGFSEPEAGSDLASLRTTATRDADGWLVSGQKVWTSYAAMASWCVLAAVTAPSEPTSRRLTLFLVPMDRPGIEVRPIASMLGPHHLNEVFIDELRVTDADVLGTPGDGWRIMRDALAYERVGIARYARCEALLERVREFLRDGWDDLPESVRTRWVRALIEIRVAKLLAYVAVGGEDGVDDAAASAARIVTTTLDQTVAELLFEALGSAALDTGTDAALHGAVEDHWRYAQAATVASGTIEIQRVITARDILGGR